jgi:RNA polymerase sigma-70 factor (ECF subfamily)
LLGAQAQPEEGHHEAAPRRAWSRPPLRSEPGRPADSGQRAFSVLDRIERAAPEDERLARLVEEAQAGDPFAFADIYIALFDRVHRWLQVALKDREDARDAAQQVFLRAFEALPRYTEEQGFRAWLFSIARNLAYDRLHAASRSTRAMDPVLLAERHELTGERLGGSADRPFDGGIQTMIEDLPPTQQRVLTLRFVSDMSSDDIGDLLGMSADSVRHVQQRALRSLARAMSTEAGTQPARERCETPPVGSHAAGAGNPAGSRRVS